MRFKMQYLKVSIITSLFWLLLVVCLLMLYTDCITPKPFLSCKHEIITDENVESFNQNHFDNTTSLLFPEPQMGPGEMGRGVTFPDDLKKEVSEKFKINQFNLMASDLISVNRSLRDVRIPGCQMKKYPTEDLPPTSIIIVFHNEAWSTLIRTIWSIINRSPRHLLQEIILVDDASARDFLGSNLDQYVNTLPIKVIIERLKVRSGLVKARLRGASIAKGPVLTFLDAHCECSEGWLEPLLYEIYKNKNTVASPLIDVISDSTFEYIIGSDVTWGGFGWTLNFKWYQVPQREMKRRNMDRTVPIRTPVMAGGLFSIARDYFYHIGSYDEGMTIWGGENLEISFRVWMCGGQLLIVTCSRVGHVFRKATPYSFPGGTSEIIDRNNARLTEVWLDEWKQFYYTVHPSSSSRLAGDVSQRVELRRDLHCKPFRWYLENIFPESQMPIDHYFFGQIKNAYTGLCLDTLRKSSNSPIGLGPCKKLKIHQLFLLSRYKTLQNENFCLSNRPNSDSVKLVPCHHTGANHKWTYISNTRVFQLSGTPNCLDGTKDIKHKNLPFVAPCSGSMLQQWILINLSWKKG